MRPRARALAVLCGLLFALGGCGDGGEQELSTQGEERGQKATATAPLPPGVSAKDRARIAQLRESFPTPTAETEAGREAIAQGREACEGKSPAEVKAELYARVRSELSPEQREMLERLPSYEARAESEYSFVAGQLAALLYEKSLPEGQASYGFQGCVHELARGLEARVVVGGGG